MEQEMTALQKVEAMGGILDKLVESTGRAKCGYVWVLNDLIEKLHNDILIMEEQINDLNKQKMSPEGEPQE